MPTQSVIGDSITRSAWKYGVLDGILPGILVDEQVSRSMTTAPAAIDAHLAAGDLRRFVVIALATNSPISYDELTQIYEQIGQNRSLILVNAFGPERLTYIPETNAIIQQFAADHPHVFVADWNATISGHTEYLAGDFVHPEEMPAKQLWGNMLKDTLTKAASQ